VPDDQTFRSQQINNVRKREGKNFLQKLEILAAFTGLILFFPAPASPTIHRPIFAAQITAARAAFYRPAS